MEWISFSSEFYDQHMQALPPLELGWLFRLVAEHPDGFGEDVLRNVPPDVWQNLAGFFRLVNGSYRNAHFRKSESGSCGVTAQRYNAHNHRGSETNQPGNEPPPPKRMDKNGRRLPSANFLLFMEAYPQAKRKRAGEAWNAWLECGFELISELVLSKLAEYCDSWEASSQYCPLPARWIRNSKHLEGPADWVNFKQTKKANWSQ